MLGPEIVLTFTYRLLLYQFDKCGRSARPRLNLTITSDLQKVCILKIQNLFIRPIKIVHPTYNKCLSDLQNCASDLKNVCILPSKVVHPTYKSSASDSKKFCIRPTKVVHRTYKKCASDQQKYVHPTYNGNYILTRSPVPA